jgi:hypothetical protein
MLKSDGHHSKNTLLIFTNSQIAIKRFAKLYENMECGHINSLRDDAFSKITQLTTNARKFVKPPWGKCIWWSCIMNENQMKSRPFIQGNDKIDENLRKLVT